MSVSRGEYILHGGINIAANDINSGAEDVKRGS